MAADAAARSGILERPWAFWTMLVAATLLGAALRLHGLEKPSLWVDEFFTIARAGSDELHWTNALGYLPTRLSLWLDGADLDRIGLGNIVEWPALGASERAARLGPCWVGILTVPILALLSRRVAGGGVAGAAALLVAITPWHLHGSQMARYYTIEFLFTSAFVLLLALGMQTGRRLHFALAAAAAILAYLAHPTAIFIAGVCIVAVGLAWIARAPLPNLGSGLVTLALAAGACGFLLVVKELAAGPKGLGDFAGQSWDPPLLTLLLGTVVRIEPVTCVTGLGFAIVAARRRDPFGILLAAIAVLVPLGVLALKPIFPVAPRYYFPSFFAWALLASMWAVEIGRRPGTLAGGLVGATGLAALLVAVGFDTYLYTRDGSGARERWRDAYAYVQQHGGPQDPVFAETGGFQAQYYLGRDVATGLPSTAELASLAPGTWLIERSRGADPPVYGPLLDVKARYEIPSRPWSWVLYVMRVPAP